MGDVGSTFLGAVFVGLLLHPQAGLVLSACFLSPLPCSAILFFVFPLAFLPDSVFSKLTSVIFFSVYIRPVGPIFVSHFRSSLPHLFYRSLLFGVACLGSSLLL